MCYDVTLVLRCGLGALLLCSVGCSVRNDRPAPSSPGVWFVSAGTYGGAPYVPVPGDLVFEDTSDGTRYNFAGQAFSGPGADERIQLAVLPAVTAFWFAWSTHHPGATLWPEGTVNPGGRIRASARCGVPCDEIVPACSGIDCIPSIDEPVWVGPDERDGRTSYLEPADRVLGLAEGALARAYPLDTLWTHEIVNDTVAGVPVSVTYCPLTGSGLRVSGRQEGVRMDFGVSGNLFNSNLVMYDRTTYSLYGQMRAVGIRGDRMGAPLETGGLLDTTWERWVAMYPHTEVLDERHASEYPYGDFREDHDDVFMRNNPEPDPAFPAKNYAIGLTATGRTAVWPFDALDDEIGAIGLVEDEVGDLPVLVAYDAAGPTAVVLSRLIDGEARNFVVVTE